MFEMSTPKHSRCNIHIRHGFDLQSSQYFSSVSCEPSLLMVLVGVGILTVTFSIVAYRYRNTIISHFPRSAGHLQNSPTLTKTSSNGDLADEKPQVPTFTVNDKPDETQNGHLSEKPHSKESLTTESHHSPSQQPANNLQTVNVKMNGGDLTPSRMPPPSLPASKSASRAPPKPSTTLRPPPSAASTLRVPPGRSLAPPSSSLAPSTSTLAPSKRPSRKVLLEPGHSPLDWAHLTANPPTSTFLRGEDVPPSLIRVPPSLLKYHNGRKDKTGKKKDAWGVYQGKVYNMTPYMDFHPGGKDQLMRGAGREDAEKLFHEIHPWVSWENMLGECLVGILVSENEANGDGGMEDMD